MTRMENAHIFRETMIALSKRISLQILPWKLALPFQTPAASSHKLHQLQASCSNPYHSSPSLPRETQVPLKVSASTFDGTSSLSNMPVMSTSFRGTVWKQMSCLLWQTSFWVTGSRQMYSQGLAEYKCVLPVGSVNQFLKSQLAKWSPVDSVFLEE